MPSHDQVAHAWAHQTGKQRNGKRLFYKGDRIYSHGRHFLIARLLDVNGVPSVLFTTREYSVSTSQHKSIVAGACSHLPIYYVEDPGHFPNLADWERHLQDANELATKSRRAHKEWNINHYLSQAQSAADRANSLNAAFDLKLPEVTIETLGVHLANREARIEKARKLEERNRRKAAKERFEREAETRTAWLAGAEGVHWRGTAPNGSALLRIKGETLETSQGASVPVDHAIKAFRFVKLCRDTKTAWHRNGHTLHVGQFSIDSIEANGNFRAGCHIIEWSEAERIAKELSLSDEVSTDALQSSEHAA